MLFILTTVSEASSFPLFCILCNNQTEMCPCVLPDFMNTVCKVGISISDFYSKARYVFIMPDICTSQMRKSRGTWGGGAEGNLL
jgi:hypothetical protein